MEPEEGLELRHACYGIVSYQMTETVAAFLSTATML